MLRTLTLATALALGLTGATSAQDYPWKPDKPITLIVPWAAGGSTDQVSRVAAAEIEKALGQKIVVVNQPGASGSIGTRNAWRADWPPSSTRSTRTSSSSEAAFRTSSGSTPTCRSNGSLMSSPITPIHH